MFTLEEIKGMDVDSFEYQQAISQITQQEQGEAEEMIGNMKGAWMISHFPFIIAWSWVSIVYFIFSLIICLVGYALFSDF